ncbi:MAG TPA: sigma-54 dependent transcriptional regulator [Vicinamibacterales bacterium]
MQSLLWHGPPPPPSMSASLEQRGFHVRTGGNGDPQSALVVCTSTSRPPAAPDSAAGWLWVSRQPIADADAATAVLRGAYAVVSLSAADALEAIVNRAEELLTPDVPIPELPPNLVATCAASRRLIAKVARVAPTSMPVLLVGETGTGKELVSRLIHSWSLRRQKAFVPINCSAIPDELMEAELFGYARGAFSGAVQRYDGQLMAAEGGTVFLDEIDDTPLEAQVKLLRVLEDKVVSRLGENQWHVVDFRLIAATNRDLRALIDAGLFGADLYERLAIVTIRLTPLRERREDVPALAREFVARFAREQQRPPLADIAPDALRALAAYPWPGNIRELRNVIFETLAYKRTGTTMLLSDLPRRILRKGAGRQRESAVDRSALAAKIDRGAMNLREEVAALERVAIEEALKRSGGNAARAARLLGRVGRGASRDPGGTLRAMMRRLAAR